MVKTKHLREGKELILVSFKTNFTKDIAPAVLLCYQMFYEDAVKLHQVKAHDIRAFVASKAFQGGSLDQILSACHWKSHNSSK